MLIIISVDREKWLSEQVIASEQWATHGYKIHFLWFPELGFFLDLPEGIETKEDNNVDV